MPGRGRKGQDQQRERQEQRTNFHELPQKIIVIKDIMTTQDGKKRVIVTLDADLLNQFDALCRERGQCRANAIEAMMRRYLARQVRSERKEREICWDPDRMILHALAVQKDVRALSSALDRHEDLLMGQGHVRPVLLALATEIALKAWQCRERKGPPDHGHDLVELFDALSEDARERLQAQLPEWPWPLGARWSDLARDPFGGKRCERPTLLFRLG